MNATLDVLLTTEGWDDLSDWPRPLAYALAAMVCALLGTSTSLARRAPAGVHQLWLGLCPLYLLISASCLVQGDVLWLDWARHFASKYHLYEERRLFQCMALLAVLLVARKGRQKFMQMQQHSAYPSLVTRNMLLTGAGGTLAITLLRYVSFHYTDAALNATVFEHSVAFWMECTSLGLASLGTGLELLRSYDHV